MSNTETRQQALDRFNEFAKNCEGTGLESETHKALLQLATHQERVIQEMRQELNNIITHIQTSIDERSIPDISHIWSIAENGLSIADAPYKEKE